MDEKVRERLFLSLNIFLQFLGHSTYGVFVPIFILKAGFSLEELFLYGISDGLGTILGAIIAPALIRKFGLKFPLVFRAIFQPIWLVLFVNNANLPFPIQAYGFVFGIFTCIYWVSVTTYTVNSSDRKERGFFAGITSSMIWFASIIAPLFGAFVIRIFGYSALFASAILVLSLAIIPALLLPKIRYVGSQRHPEISEKKKILGAMVLLYIIIGGSGIALYYAWPVFVYRQMGGELQVGLLASLGSFFGLAGALFGGWISDKASKTRIIATSGVVLAFGWFASAFANGALFLSAIVSMRRFSDEVTANSLFAKFSNIFAEDDLVLRMGERQLAIGTGLVLFGILAFFVPLETFFVFTGMFFLLYSAVISDAYFKTKRKLALSKGTITLIERVFYNK